MAGSDNDWSRLEVEDTVADYLRMLTLELSGQRFNKTQYRKALLLKLRGRSDGAVEFKRSNISAILIALGYPYIRGYQPRSNYQQLLFDVVASQLANHQPLNAAAMAAVQLPASVANTGDFETAETSAPIRQHKIAEYGPTYVPVKRDYLEREAANRSLGLAGEEFVMRFEDWRLRKAGKKHLAEKIEHVARLRGDGAGYDVLSFDVSGRERLIEVKTTAFGKETPFFVSRTEASLSESAPLEFHLYRVFQFRQVPKLFDMRGPISSHCQLDAVSFKATFA